MRAVVLVVLALVTARPAAAGFHNCEVKMTLLETYAKPGVARVAK